jgi:hypothetical protein
MTRTKAGYRYRSIYVVYHWNDIRFLKKTKEEYIAEEKESTK